MFGSVPPALTPRPPWVGRRVVLGVTGGIAAYKSVQVARDLTRLGAEVDVVMTAGAGRFVRPLSFEGVTGRPALTDLFSADGAAQHIRLGYDADVVCVAPTTADFIARAAQGRANDLLSTTLLATRAPVLISPAMNDRMFAHPQTQRNLKHLHEALGYAIVGPASGPLAFGEGEGPGRMLEPGYIVQEIGRALGADPAFTGRKVLITAGPTREPLDPVRYLGNRSSGRMGFALAEAAWLRGADVCVVAGPVAVPAPYGPEIVSVETALEMHAAVGERVGETDLNIFAAAVADFRPTDPSEDKLKRAEVGPEFQIGLTANPDIAAETKSLRRAGAVTVGFALETSDLVENAQRKLDDKGFDLIVANDATDPLAGFDVDTNVATLVWREGEPEALPTMTKHELAERILQGVAALLGEGE